MTRAIGAAALLLLGAAAQPASAVESLDCVRLFRHADPLENRVWDCWSALHDANIPVHRNARWYGNYMIIVPPLLGQPVDDHSLVRCYCPGAITITNRYANFRNFAVDGVPYPVEYHHFVPMDCNASITAGK